MAVLPSLGALWRFARRVDGLFALQRKTEDALEAVERRSRELEERVARLDSEQARLVTEARRPDDGGCRRYLGGGDREHEAIPQDEASRS